MKTAPPTLIFCDFDGTITNRDIIDLIWTACIGPDWIDEIFPRSDRGTAVSMVERIDLGFRRVSFTPDQIFERMAATIHLRDGFSEFVRTAGHEQWNLRVLSCGLEVYIEKLLPAGIPCDCFIGEFDGTWRVHLPPGVELSPGEDWKPHMLKKRAALHPGARLVYIGDGQSDFDPARLCDVVFAVHGSRLARLCRSHGVACTEFSHFEDVAKQLAG
jgi:2-hydroxy-3-keto-5-methylthiopentenyl-1-phosphate phosphatase